MRVFVTGATGFIGSAVVQELIRTGHQVVGLARSDAAAKSLIAVGAQAHRGGTEDLESLRKGAAAADGVIHTAFFHEFSHASLSTRLRVMFGGSPGDMVSRFVAAAVEADRRAIETLGTALAGPDRSLVVAFATMALKPGRLATEDNAYDPSAAGGPAASRKRQCWRWLHAESAHPWCAFRRLYMAMAIVAASFRASAGSRVKRVLRRI